MSCLQHHQLTGTHKGFWTDVTQLLVSSEKPERKKGRNKKGSFCLILCDRLSAHDSQSVHLCAVEGAIRHLLDAISGEPSVTRKRCQVTEMKLQD